MQLNNRTNHHKHLNQPTNPEHNQQHKTTCQSPATCAIHHNRLAPKFLFNNCDSTDVYNYDSDKQPVVKYKLQQKTHLPKTKNVFVAKKDGKHSVNIEAFVFLSSSC